MSSNNNASKFNWLQGFTIDFDLKTGLSKGPAESSKRHVSQMRGMYADEAATEALAKNGDPLVYEFYELGAPEKEGDLAFGSSITYPGELFGPKIIKAFKGPLPQMKMMPTGGVTVENISEWIKAGAVAVGAGSSLTAGAKKGDYASIVTIGKQMVEEVKKARTKK